MLRACSASWADSLAAARRVRTPDDDEDDEDADDDDDDHDDDDEAEASGPMPAAAPCKPSSGRSQQRHSTVMSADGLAKSGATDRSAAVMTSGSFANSVRC